MVTTAATTQATIDRISRMKPRIIASNADINMTPSRITSRSVIGKLTSDPSLSGVGGRIGLLRDDLPDASGDPPARVSGVCPNSLIFLTNCRYRERGEDWPAARAV